MCISDWSSDVCSSDLRHRLDVARDGTAAYRRRRGERDRYVVPGHQAGRGPHDLRAGRRGRLADPGPDPPRSEEHTSELQSLMRISYAVFCLNKKTHAKPTTNINIIKHTV